MADAEIQDWVYIAAVSHPQQRQPCTLPPQLCLPWLAMLPVLLWKWRPPSPPCTWLPLSPDLQQWQAWPRGRRRHALHGSIRSAAGEPPRTTDLPALAFLGLSQADGSQPLPSGGTARQQQKMRIEKSEEKNKQEGSGGECRHEAAGQPTGLFLLFRFK